MSKDARRSKKTYGFYRQRPILTAVTGSDHRVTIVDETRFSKSYPSTRQIPSISTIGRLQGPAVYLATPSHATNVGGTTIVIQGDHFTNQSKVFFDGLLAGSITVSSSTTLTCTTPGHSAGPVNVSVSNANGVGGNQAIFSYDADATFDPATLALSGWWKASFSSAPWVGNASAGGSVGRNLVTNGADPSAGSAQNSLVPADFNGTTQNLNTADTNTTLFSTTGMTIVCLFAADSAVASTGNFYDDAALLADTGGNGGLTFSSSGITGVYVDASVAYKSKTVACAANSAYNLVMMRCDTSNLGITLNSTAEVTQAIAGGGLTLGASASTVGGSYGSSHHFDGRILELMTARVTLTATDYGHIKSYINTRYGLAL